jgi:hypothetical protein
MGGQFQRRLAVHAIVEIMAMCERQHEPAVHTYTHGYPHVFCADRDPYPDTHPDPVPNPDPLAHSYKHEYAHAHTDTLAHPHAHTYSKSAACSA